MNMNENIETFWEKEEGEMEDQGRERQEGGRLDPGQR